MSGTYDEETRKLLETRKRRAELKRAQQIKKRNQTLFGIVVVIVVVILFITMISSSCSSTKNNKKEIDTKPQVTTMEEVTTPEETTNASMYTTDILNLRKAPGTDSDIITQIGAGKKVKILKEQGEWCKVQRGKDVGYVMRKYLSYENTVN